MPFNFLSLCIISYTFVLFNSLISSSFDTFIHMIFFKHSNPIPIARLGCSQWHWKNSRHVLKKVTVASLVLKREIRDFFTFTLRLSLELISIDIKPFFFAYLFAWLLNLLWHLPPLSKCIYVHTWAQVYHSISLITFGFSYSCTWLMTNRSVYTTLTYSHTPYFLFTFNRQFADS